MEKKKSNTLFKEFVAAVVVLGLIYGVLSLQIKDTGEVMGLELHEYYQDRRIKLEQLEMEFHDKMVLVVESTTYNGTVEFSDCVEVPVIRYFTKKQIDATYSGVISLSYDLEKASVEYTEKGILVTLPEVEIYSHELTLENVKENNNTFNKIKYSDYELITNNIKESELENAINEGLYDQAKESIEDDLTDLIEKVMGYSMEIEFKYL